MQRIHPNGVSVLVARNGKIDTRRAKLLLIADGVRSRLRDQIGSDHAARHSGYEAWRAMISADSLPTWLNLDFTHLIMARNGHAVLYPVHSKRYLNVVVCFKTNDRDLANTPVADRDYLLKRTRFWSCKLRQLFKLADGWSVWPILERPQTSFWEGGPVALIGDAAHAMPPFAAQGAAMAIEDAEILARNIETSGPTPDALEAYSASRTKRIAQMRKLARTNGSLYHMGWPFSLVRNLGMRMIPRKQLLTRQSWVYNWRP